MNIAHNFLLAAKQPMGSYWTTSAAQAGMCVYLLIIICFFFKRLLLFFIWFLSLRLHARSRLQSMFAEASFELKFTLSVCCLCVCVCIHTGREKCCVHSVCTPKGIQYTVWRGSRSRRTILACEFNLSESRCTILSTNCSWNFSRSSNRVLSLLGSFYALARYSRVY